MLDSLFTWLLLPVGLAFGWALGRKSAAGQVPPEPQRTIQPEQLGGLLTQLASDDPDQAIAALTQVAEIDESTVELHMTLGNLFRKRGEMDRALRIHEALLARPGLDADTRAQVRRELAYDFLRAGVMDHAEEQFEQLVSDGYYVGESLDQIRIIFEQGRDWEHAIAAARRLEGAQGESRRALIAQYACEMADEALRAKDVEQALRQVRRAIDEDTDCVRAYLQLGAIEEGRERYAAAAQAYLRAFQLDQRFLPDVIEPLFRCSQKTGSEEGYLQFLADAKEISSSSLPYVAEARLLADEGMDPLDRLAQGLEVRPSRAVLAEFLEVLEKQPGVIAAGLDKPAASLRQALRRLMESTPRYQCSNCGFSPRQQFWQCPSCKRWGSITPIDEAMRLPGA
ncbi:tetratricopeptide repeat protein [Solimonas marina]|uniref:Lipopolysaccharide assembly protein B n=1 Tax=Solimonas marina TaxID=2714601 RepID=A0A969WDB2_9GAMM|nr:tetratricopeptide repeat protein [Solimonas marina]NKF22695.1 tetratricopeptide repeat protein [Solimonas marina]